MHDCPCCGNDGITYTDDPDDMCSCCEEAGCEDHEVEDGDGSYFECQVPQCEECETRYTFCTDGKWHDNCEPDCVGKPGYQKGAGGMTEHAKGPFAPKPEHKPYPGHGCELYADKIRQALDAEDWEEADHNTDTYGQERRLYLGSVFGCTPSGKFYMPFACSNVMGCDSCKGLGTVPRFRKRRVCKRQQSRALRIRKRYEARAKVNFETAQAWVRGRHAWRNQYGRPCTACGGLGSREAHLDELWREYAESVCESVGACLMNGEDSSEDLFIVEYRDTPDEGGHDMTNEPEEPEEPEEGEAHVSES